MLKVKHINEAIVLGILDLKAFSQSNPLNSKRELEKSGSLYTIQQILESNFIQIEYASEGKPFLKNRKEHISISHSHDYLAVIVDRKNITGCDIELIRDKVKTIQHKFLNDEEKTLCNHNTEELILLWAAKETLYKIYGLKALDFKQNISIEHFDNNKIIGKITKNDYQKSYVLNWERLENYILVYSLNEI